MRWPTPFRLVADAVGHWPDECHGRNAVYLVVAARVLCCHEPALAHTSARSRRTEKTDDGIRVRVCGDLVVPDEVESVRLTALNEDRTEVWTGCSS